MRKMEAGRCIARKENDLWKVTIVCKHKPMRIVEVEDFEDVKKVCSEEDLKLEVLDKEKFMEEEEKNLSEENKMVLWKRK